MKIFCSIVVAVCSLLIGCGDQEGDQVISICVFEPLEPDKESSKSDFIVLKAYTDSLYNPSGRASLLSDGSLEEAGYKYRVSARQPLNSSTTGGFRQNVPTDSTKEQLVAVGKITPNGDDSYELSAFVGTHSDATSEESYSGRTVSNPSVGTIALSNGWVVVWSVQPE